MPTSSYSQEKDDLDDQAKFEAMRGHSRKTQIFRRHQDLEREHFKQMNALAKEARMAALDANRGLAVYKKKLSRYEGICAGGSKNKPKFQNRNQIQVAPPKLRRQKKDVLLFKVEKREGIYNYIREEKKEPDFSHIFFTAPSTSSTRPATSLTDY